MARGYKGWFGRKLNDTRLWLAFCAVFLIALVDWRRILTLRTLDLVALLSFSVSLWYFERGLVFWAVPLQYPPMIYLIARLDLDRAARRGRADASTGRLPPWALAALVVFLIGFRLGLNAFDATVIDVGYAGTVGADRRAARASCRTATSRTRAARPAASSNSDGTSSAYRQAKQDDRCESPVANGDTYGPVNYAAYVPAVAVAGWTGRWDDLPASHGTSAIFDLACVAGMAAVGWRFGRLRLALLCGLAWVAYPFTGYALQANTNDMIVAAFAIWGFAFAASPIRRGALLALASWTKFAPLVLWPLWSRYPRGEAAPRRSFARGVAGLALGTALAGLLLLPGRLRRRAAVLGSHGGVPDGALVAVLGLGVGHLSRLPRPRRAADRARGPARDLRGRARVPPAQARPRPARRALGGADAGVRARAHPLVVPLPALGVPVRAASARAAVARDVGGATRHRRRPSATDPHTLGG